MATTRMRRAGAKPGITVDADGDRIYTEEDYAAMSSEAFRALENRLRNHA